MAVLDKSIDFYFEKGFDLDKTIANSLLLTTSVIIVFTADKAINSVFAAFSMVCFGITLLLGVSCLFVLKTMTLLGYNTLTEENRRMRMKEAELESMHLSDGRVIADEFSKVLSAIDITSVGKMRDRLSIFFRYAFISFFVGMVLMILGIILKW